MSQPNPASHLAQPHRSPQFGESSPETPTVNNRNAGALAGDSAFQRILDTVRPDLHQVDDLLANHLVDHSKNPIPDLAQHLIGAGGKRCRPVLTLAAAHVCGYRGSHHIRLAAAVELIHSATLLHDDVVDESPLRRGRTTANRIWGNKLGVLVGDFLLSRSFQLMVQSESLPILGVLSAAAVKISEGEVQHTEFSRSLETTEEVYLQVVRAKTAELFAAAAEVGARIADADPGTAQAFREYGMSLGIAFQLSDDALDYCATDAATGKAQGDDFQEGKATLPVLIANRLGDAEARRFWQRTITLDERGPNDFERACELLAKTDAIEATYAIAEMHAANARAALAVLPESPLVQALSDFATSLTRRPG